jgi:hypothetical protein
VLKICKKEAIFKIPNVLVIKTINGLSCLRLLLTIIKLMLFMLLAACEDSSERMVKAITPVVNTANANAHGA